MSPRAARRLAWSIWALALALGLGSVPLMILSRDTEVASAFDVGAPVDILYGLLFLAFATVGALVASRRPGNAIGWILVGGGLLMAVQGFVEAYGIHALYTDPGNLPGGAWAAWMAGWVYIPTPLAMPALLFLLFPGGRPPGPRWRWAIWLTAVSAAAATLDTALAATIDDAPFKGVASPLSYSLPEGVLPFLSFVGWPGMALALVLGALAMVLRLRRSRGIERQQLRWIAAAASILPPVILAGVIAFYAGEDQAGGALVILASLPIPLAAGYAILRHRLYDVGLVVNRALVYGSLTALLAGAYLGLVLLLGQALSPLTDGSGVAVAMSTLAVAALFQPLRRRLQRLVDRRFYRRRYDAARTLEGFSARLQAQTWRRCGPTWPRSWAPATAAPVTIPGRGADRTGPEMNADRDNPPDNLLDHYERVIAPAQPLAGPFPVVRARGAWLETSDGRRLIDGISGIATINLGHDHPRVQAVRPLRTLAGGCPAGPFGRVPIQVPLEDAQESARSALLASLKRAVADLDNVAAWLTVTGFVNADPGYPTTTLVMNPVSELLLDLYGPDAGSHARVAPGVAALLLDLPVIVAAEVEMRTPPGNERP